MSQKTKILLSGITSFSGCYIAAELIKSGYKVYAPLLKAADQYTGLKAQRLKLASGAELIAPCDIGTVRFIELINEIKPQVFINHGGYVQNYRSLDFDFLKHLETNLKHIKVLTSALQANGCKLFIHSGSAFEPGEECSQYGVSPYGVAKKMVWDMTCFWCLQNKLPVVKLVIPNPYGHLENDDRLLPVFAKLIKEGKPIKLSEPAVVRNNIKGEDLAKHYLQAVQLISKNLPVGFVSIVKPVGHLETQHQFVLRALGEEPYAINIDKINSLLSC
jgi:nucleoside-diphosphate-sugar epimerase